MPEHQPTAEGNALTNYIRRLHHEGAGRALYDEFAPALRGATPWQVNEAIHVLIDDVTTDQPPAAAAPRAVAEVFDTIETTVARFIRACSIGLDVYPPPDAQPASVVHQLLQDADEFAAQLRRVSGLYKELNAAAAPWAEQPQFAAFRDQVATLAEVAGHYRLLQNAVFPAFERQEAYKCVQLMWHIQDRAIAEIAQLSRWLGRIADGQSADAASAGAASAGVPAAAVPKAVHTLIGSVFLRMNALLYREKHILLPIVAQTAPSLVNPTTGPTSAATATGAATASTAAAPEPVMQALTTIPAPVLHALFAVLPLDMTYVDENDCVRYFSEGRQRVFPRAPGIIGRQVRNCHPPAGIGAVERVIADLRSGRRSEALFWLQYHGRFIVIRYVAIFVDGQYRGIVETTQDVSEIQSLTGERRLLSDAP